LSFVSSPLLEEQIPSHRRPPSPGNSLALQLYRRRRNQLPEEKFRQGMPGRYEAENPRY
jgi:hypothetical protein